MNKFMLKISSNNNQRKLSLILNQCLLGFFILFPQAQAQVNDDDIIIPRRVEIQPELLKKELLPDETILTTREKVISRDDIVPHLAMKTLTDFRENTDIFIQINNNLENEGIPDIGQAQRHDYLGRRHNECVVSFNEDSVAFTNTTHNNIFVKMNFNNVKIKEFIFLHEFAHCYDGELSPKNIDSIQWREALADGYAMATLLSNNLINSYQIKLFKKERERFNAIGSTFMLNKIVEFYHTDIEPLNLTPTQRLNKIKLLRKSVFLNSN